MSLNDDQPNPYAPPTPDAVPKRGETHREFQLTAKGIRCRTGLELPMICLVTGRTHDIEPIPIKLMWHSPTARLIIIAASVLMAALPIGQLLAARYLSVDEFPILQLSQRLSPITRVLFVIAIQIPMVAAILLSPKAALTGFVHRDVQRWMKRQKRMFCLMIAVFPVAVGVIVFCAIQGTVVWLLVLLWLCVTGSFVVMILMSLRNRQRFSGLSLKAIGHQHGQFEVSGFSPLFLQAVQNRP